MNSAWAMPFRMVSRILGARTSSALRHNRFSSGDWSVRESWSRRDQMLERTASRQSRSPCAHSCIHSVHPSGRRSASFLPRSRYFLLSGLPVACRGYLGGDWEVSPQKSRRIKPLLFTSGILNRRSPSARASVLSRNSIGEAGQRCHSVACRIP
jgi:hypothetical protein